MYNIEAEHIAQAHQKACKIVIEEGEVVVTEDGQETLELSEPLAILVKHPLEEPMRHPANALSLTAMNIYLDEILTPENPKGFTYTYGERLNAFKFRNWSGDEETFNQIESMKYRLINEPTSRRAIAHTWIVEHDVESRAPPCLQTVQVVQRSGKFNMVCTFRSNDMSGAWGNNAYGLAFLLNKFVVDYGKGDVGYLQTVSTCAHIYLNDIVNAKRIAYG